MDPDPDLDPDLDPDPNPDPDPGIFQTKNRINFKSEKKLNFLYLKMPNVCF